MRQFAVAALVLGGCLTASAENHYIRADANGGANDGSSWANAWTTFKSVRWIRGDTYFVAGGTYAEDIAIGAGAAGGKWITLKKANPADNSKDAGWAASYAATPAVIAGAMRLSGGCIELDGVTGEGTAGHGIRISNPLETTVLALTRDSGPYRILHCEIRGQTRRSKVGFDGIHYNNGALQKSLRVASCWIRECGKNGICVGGVVGTSYDDYGMLFENNVVEHTGGNLAGAHSNPMQISYANQDAYLIIRGNVFRNTVGSAPVTYLGGPNAKHSFSRIYNNLFINTDRSNFGCSPGVIWAHAGSTSCSDIEVYNNTFYGIKLAQCALDPPSAARNVLRNNLWENCHFTGPHRGFAEQSNNGYFGNTGGGVPKGTKNQINGSSTTFVDANAGDFRLLPNGYAVGAGAALTDIFKTDFGGRPRGDKWNIGAAGVRAQDVGTQPAGDTRPFRSSIGMMPVPIPTGLPPGQHGEVQLRP